MSSAPYLSPEYRGYIKSPQWAARRAKYYRRHPKRCWACGSTKWIELDHIDYDSPFGREPDSSLVPLCRYHHVLVTTMTRRGMPHRVALKQVRGQAQKQRATTGPGRRSLRSQVIVLCILAMTVYGLGALWFQTVLRWATAG